jgi:hypothetical protein
MGEAWDAISHRIVRVSLVGLAKSATLVDELNCCYRRDTSGDDSVAIVADGEPAVSVIDHVSAHDPGPSARPESGDWFALMDTFGHHGGDRSSVVPTGFPELRPHRLTLSRT